jgi:flagellar hook-associated protein 1
MAGLSSTLEIAKNTLLNYQFMIQTATHNIANADNKAYARQRANLITNLPTHIAAGWIGNGARIDQISQLRDQYIEKQLLGSISQESDYRARSTLLGMVSARLRDDGAQGLSQDLGAFWDSWDALGQNPQGLVEKDGVLAATHTLVDSIRDAQAGINDLRQGIQTNIRDDIPQINDLLSQVADLNQQIMSLEAGGNNANDLRDQRYQALTDLAQYVDIDYTEQPNGAVTVNLTDGATSVNLVSDQNAGRLQYDTGNHLISYTDAGGAAINPAVNSLTGGSLNGMLTTVTKIDAYEAQLNTFTAALIDRVNTQYDVGGTGARVLEGTSAADISVNSTFDNAVTINGAPALAMAELQNTGFPELGSSRLGEYLGSIQQKVGQDQRSATSRADFQRALSLELSAQQQSISGVSIDEETIDLLKFQQVYQAAAKIVQRTGEMLQTVIDMV